MYGAGDVRNDPEKSRGKGVVQRVVCPCIVCVWIVAVGVCASLCGCV